MSKVTVYEFMVPDFRAGEHLDAKGKATRETIASLHGIVIENTDEIIDESLLNENGRYHADRPNR